MVSSKGDEEGSNDPEWENQIEQMLEAEEKQEKQNWWSRSKFVYSFWMWYVIPISFCVLQKILYYNIWNYLVF